MEMLRIILTAVLSALGSFVASSGFWTYMMNKDKKKSAERKIIEGIAHDSIIAACKTFTDRGYIFNDELKDLKNYYYDPYRELGGNGTAEKAYNDVLHLPLKYR